MERDIESTVDDWERGDRFQKDDKMWMVTRVVRREPVGAILTCIEIPS